MTASGRLHSSWPWRRSLRTRLVLLVGVGILLPLLLLAAWMTRRLQRAGEELLRTQLETTLASVGAEMEAAWQRRHGELLLLADNEVTRRALTDPVVTFDGAERQFLAQAFAIVQSDVDEAVFSDAAGRVRWRVAPDPGMRPRVEVLANAARAPTSRPGTVAVAMPVTSADGARVVGTMTVLLHLSAILPATPSLRPTGASFDVVDPRLGVSLLAPRRASAAPDSPDTLGAAGGDGAWLGVRRELTDPPLVLVAGAPVRPYVAPFERSARGVLVVLVAALAVTMTLVGLVATRATRSLATLAAAADAVARGEMEGRVPVSSTDELGRLALAFNLMTRELQRTVRQAAQRRALAAVGEFAAELAHEVRNPLTSVRLDLQRLDERLPSDAPGREQLRRALSALERLNRTVTGALRVARSSSVTLRPIPLAAALEPALETVLPQFAARGVALERPTEDGGDVLVRGDADALAQLFANLLLNALEAAGPDGRVALTVAREVEDTVTVAIADSGPGIPARVLAELAEPEPAALTTKRDGTGLGLRIAARIAEAHDGRLVFEQSAEWGTVARVTLPTTVSAAPRRS